MMRVLRAVVAAVVTTALVVGVPLLLLGWGQLGQLERLIDPSSWTSAADARLLLGPITALGWLAWGFLLVSFTLELIGLVTAGRWRPRPRSLSWIQPLAAVLVAAMASGLAGSVVPVVTQASGTPVAVTRPVDRSPSATGASNPAGVTAPETGTAVKSAPTEATDRHQVVAGDDLWSLATECLGEGRRWREIVALNAGLDADQPLQAGTWLRLPRPTRTGVPVVQSVPRAVPTTTTVKAGDSLWLLAGRLWGDPERWPELYAANRPLIDDPDELEIGWVLVVPTTTTGVQAATRPLPTEQSSPHQMARQTPGSATEPTTEAIPSPVGARASSQGQGQGAAGQRSLTADPLRLALGSMTALLAAGVATSLLRRRGEQLDQRVVGTRLLGLSEPAAEAFQVLSTAAAEAELPVEVGPGHVVIGEDEAGLPVLVDLARTSRFTIQGAPALAVDLLGGLVTGVASADWTQDTTVLVVGPNLAWVEALDSPMVSVEPDPVQALRTWMRIAAARQLADAAGELESGLDLLVLGEPLSIEHQQLLDQISAAPGMSVVAVEAGAAVNPWIGSELPIAQPEASVRLESATTAWLAARSFTPQLIGVPMRRALIELHRTWGSSEALPAPWWVRDDPPGSPPMINNRPELPPNREEDSMTEPTSHPGPPRLLVLGPVVLVGAQGRIPTRAIKQCEEYCGWLLEHPGRSSSAMVSSLLVAETTRRSNMSRLRSWLGHDRDGEPFLPDAYTGRIALHPQVSSDWEELQLLISGGVNRTTNQALVEGLDLVRGAPLADAAPGQWHWAEQWRQDMISTIRDMACVLAERAVQTQDWDVARWAVAKGLVVAPADELLACAQIRTEFAAGDQVLVDQLVMQLTRAARARGVDLLDDTVVLIQQVIEGRARSRQA